MSSVEIGRIRYLRKVSILHRENLIAILMEFFGNLETFLFLFYTYNFTI